MGDILYGTAMGDSLPSSCRGATRVGGSAVCGGGALIKPH